MKALNENQSFLDMDQGVGTKDLVEGGLSCSTKGAILFTFGIKKALPLLHAGPGCSFTAFHGQILHTGDSYPFANTALDSDAILFGGERYLSRGLIAAHEIFNPEIIIVIPGCQSSTIGDDIDGVIKKTNLPIPAVNSGTAGYDGDLIFGFKQAGLQVLEYFCRPQAVEDRRINLIGFPANFNIYWRGDLIEIKRLLELIGLRVHCVFPGDCSVEDITSIPKSALNIVLDEQFGLEQAEYLKAKFNMPYILPEFGTVIGGDNTSQLLLDVANCLNLDLHHTSEIIEQEKAKSMGMASQGFPGWCDLFQSTLKNFGLTAPGSLALGLTRLLMCEIGFEPRLINLYPSYPGAKEKLLRLLELDGRGYTPDILEDADNFEVSQVIGEDFPLIFIGRGAGHIKSEALLSGTLIYLTITYPALDRFIIYNRPIMGYQGVPSLLDDLITRALYFV